MITNVSPEPVIMPTRTNKPELSKPPTLSPQDGVPVPPEIEHEQPGFVVVPAHVHPFGLWHVSPSPNITLGVGEVFAC